MMRFPTIPLEGFELTLAAPSVWTAARGVETRAFDAYERTSNDDLLAELWLDLPVRAALSASVSDAGWNLLTNTRRVELATASLADDEVVVRPAATDDRSVEHAMRAGEVLAQRPQRLANELRRALGPLGLRLDAPAWRMDGECVGVFTRGPARVLLDWRRAPIHTRLRVEDADTALLEQRAALVGALHHASVAADGRVVTVSWRGVVRRAAILAPAIELLAGLVAPPPIGAFR